MTGTANQLWSVTVPLEEKYPKPFADKNGNVYVLGKQTGDKYTLIRLNGSTMKWEVLVKDIKDGGQLNEVERLAASPDGSKFYCLQYDSRLRIFDSVFNMIYISSESKEDDEDLAAEHKKKVKNDEEFK